MKKLFTLVALIICAWLANANEPWWTNPKLAWKPFKALPAIGNVYENEYWEIQERSGDGNGTPKFFAIFLNEYNAGPHNFLTADASVTPSFIEREPAAATSTAMVKWSRPYNEFFIGKQTGVYRFDESTNKFVTVWPWNWPPDTTYIASLGTAVAGRVTSWGNASGYHIWKPDGTHIFEKAPNPQSVWADPVSGNCGPENYIVRVASKNKSIIIYNHPAFGNQCSLDGGINFITPAVITYYTPMLSVPNFYCYADNVIIAKIKSGFGTHSIGIGTLGGVFYPLSPPIDPAGTLFYSPSTHLLVVGDLFSKELYYTVLPASDENKLPNLQVKANSTDVIPYWNWNLQQNPVRLQSSMDLVNWQNVDLPRTTVGGQTSVNVPRTSAKLFFRLAYP